MISKKNHKRAQWELKSASLNHKMEWLLTERCRNMTERQRCTIQSFQLPFSHITIDLINDWASSCVKNYRFTYRLRWLVLFVLNRTLISWTVTTNYGRSLRALRIACTIREHLFVTLSFIWHVQHQKVGLIIEFYFNANFTFILSWGLYYPCLKWNQIHVV